MTVFVTGGTGVVGTPVVRYLVEAGREVRGLARSDASASLLAGMGATPVAGDICDPDSLARALAGCEVVYHIAGARLVLSEGPGSSLRDQRGRHPQRGACRPPGRGAQAGSHLLRGGPRGAAGNGLAARHQPPGLLPQPLRPIQAPRRVGRPRGRGRHGGGGGQSLSVQGAGGLRYRWSAAAGGQRPGSSSWSTRRSRSWTPTIAPGVTWRPRNGGSRRALRSQRVHHHHPPADSTHERPDRAPIPDAVHPSRCAGGR